MPTQVPSVLFLLPYALSLAALATRGRTLIELVLLLPTLVAGELLVTLLVARLLMLDYAIILVHGLFGLTAGVEFIRRLRRDELVIPEGLGLRSLASAFLATWLCVYLSQLLSRQCHNADRAWHIPLATSLRGQTVPFANVYEPGVPLAYHYSGDVFGAMFQVLSGAKLHQSLALALAHDVAYGWIGATVALGLIAFGSTRLLSLPLISAATVLAGPFTFMRADRYTADGGYNFISLLKVGFRPHVPWAMLFMVGLVFTLFAMLRRHGGFDSAFPKRNVAILATLVAALGLTDESSVALFGLALGAAWLAIPTLLARTRKQGILILLILAAALVVAQVVFSGSLAPGAPKHTWAVVPWRSPGYYHPTVPLSQEPGQMFLLLDVAPVVLVGFGGVVVAFAKRRADTMAIALFFAVLATLSIVLLTRIEVDKQAVESHRFMTAAMALSVPCGALCLIDDGTEQGDHFTFAHTLCVIAWMGGASSSLDWYKNNKSCTTPEKYSSREDFFRTDCHRDADAKLGEKATVSHLAQEVWYVFAGCRPVYAAGPEPSSWKVKVGIAKFGAPALEETLRNLSPAGAPLRVVCPPETIGTVDKACSFARKRNLCVPSGRLVSICMVPAQDKLELVAEAGGTPTKSSTPGAQGEGEGGH